MPPPPEADASLPFEISNLRNYTLAVSGDVFRWMVDYAAPQALQRVSSRFSPRVIFPTNQLVDAHQWQSICENVP